MASPTRRDDSSRLQLQKRIPADVVERAKGRPIVIEFPAIGTEPAVTIRSNIAPVVKFSLRTRDPSIAKQRVGLATARIQAVIANIRQGPAKLSHRQIVALSGLAYRRFVELFGDDPGEPGQWERVLAWNRAVRDGRLDFSMEWTPDAAPDDVQSANDLDALLNSLSGPPGKADDLAMEMRYGPLADWVLNQEAMEIDAGQRRTLLDEIDRAVTHAAERLRLAAGGDYRHDSQEERFPTFEGLSSNPAIVTLTSLFEAWKAETKPSPNTLMTWTGCFRQLREFLGHDDAKRLNEADVIRWKDQLLAGDRKAKTVNDSHLTALRSVLAHAVRNRTLQGNPASGVRAAVKVVAGEGALPYTDDEVKCLLTIASKESNAYKRWLPFLAAATGARIGELAQLHGSHVVQIAGIQCIKIEPTEDGGRLKNAASERIVPLHPAVIDAGFLDFVRDHGPGPLFYRRSSGIENKRHASKGVANHLGTWIREQGFTDPRKAPSHGLRHWWKSAAFKAGVPDSIADHIQGHRTSSVAARYRHFDLPTLSRNVALIAMP